MTNNPPRITTLDHSWHLKYWQQPPSDHPIYNAIGKVASEWAYYEHLLDDIIKTLIITDPKLVASITAQIMGVSNRYRAIIALCTVHGLSKKVLEKVQSAQNRSFEPQERRNRIVHDPWFMDESTSQTGQFKSMPPKTLTYGVEPINDEYIEKTLSLIADRIREASVLNEMIYDGLVTLRRRFPKPRDASPPGTAET
jgi:hypothetical protein